MFVKCFLMFGFVLKMAMSFHNYVGCDSPRAQTGVQGNFSSMNYPNPYAEYARCEWLITVPKSKIVKITFDDVFEVEKNILSPRCEDSVEVFPGSRTSFRKFQEGTYCGNKAPKSFYVKKNQALVIFKSNGNREKKGFRIQWKAVNADDVSSGCDSAQLQVGQQGNISSMNYPQPYENLARCSWLITVPSTKIIKLTFDKNFELETFGKNCWVDYVEVFEGRNSNDKKIGEYCGKEAPKEIYVNNNQAWITFKSSYRGNKKGFLIQWKAVEKAEAAAF